MLGLVVFLDEGFPLFLIYIIECEIFKFSIFHVKCCCLVPASCHCSEGLCHDSAFLVRCLLPQTMARFPKDLHARYTVHGAHYSRLHTQPKVKSIVFAPFGL
jgi:hypothetical protein